MIETLSDAGIHLSAHGTFRCKSGVGRNFDHTEISNHCFGNKLKIEKIVLRQAIAVLVAAEESPAVIAAFVGTSRSSVFRWKNRCSQIDNYEDLPRSGRPPCYTEDIRLKVIAFYCQKRPLAGCGRWSLRWASQHLEANPEHIGNDAPGKSTIQRILAGNNLKPHRTRYFLHITDPDFFPKMEHLVALYKDPPVNLFFLDECPGIQILQRITPDMQTEKTKIRIEEFEYIRNGTMDVFAILNYRDGKIFAECRCDHKTETFLDVFKRHVAGQSPKEKLHYVMDNLSTHRSYAFCQLIAELSKIPCPVEQELDSMHKRMNWLQRNDKRIVIHFTPYHGSWLNLVEIWFGIMGAKVLRESYTSAEKLKAAFDSFVIEWNCILAHPFRWTYDGHGLHRKAVTRFTQMLENSAAQMETRILTKMLMLMTNILKKNIKEVAGNVWARMKEALFSQYTTLNQVIENEKGPKRKKNAQKALDSMIAAIKQYLGNELSRLPIS